MELLGRLAGPRSVPGDLGELSFDIAGVEELAAIAVETEGRAAVGPLVIDRLAQDARDQVNLAALDMDPA